MSAFQPCARLQVYLHLCSTSCTLSLIVFLVHFAIASHFFRPRAICHHATWEIKKNIRLVVKTQDHGGKTHDAGNFSSRRKIFTL